MEMAEPVLTLSIVLAVLLGGVLLLVGKHYRSGLPGVSKSGARLPEGSFGWPVIGESLVFVEHPRKFAASHFKRYGHIFKSSLFLQRVIMGATPEFAKFVTTNSNLFVSAGPANFKQILGPNAVMFKDGPQHMAVKKILQKPIFPEALRIQVNMLETMVLENLAEWEQSGTVIAQDATRKIAFDMGIWLVLGIKDICSTPEGRKAQSCFEDISTALVSFPLNLPGTAYNKGLKAKAHLTEYFKHLIEERRGQENRPADVLGFLLASQQDLEASKDVKDLDIGTIADNLVLMWFASYDTTATTLTWILKFMVDNPEVFRRIQAEQQEILKSKDEFAEGPRLSWEDTRKMVYTQKFLQEVQRTISIVAMVIRKATQDVEYEGYLIPKGWAVWPMCALIHSDPTIYSDPGSFNPDRFDVTPKPYTYLPFSAGPKLCPGIELAKLISLIFVHHLTTTYIYDSTSPDRGIEYSSMHPRPVGGYPITVRRRNEK